MKTKINFTIASLAVATLLFSGCNPATDSGKTANLVYVNWAEGVAYTHLAAAVLEEKMGYKVKLTAADVAPGYTAVAQKSHDAFMECWVELHEDYLERYKDDIVLLGTIYEGTQVGLAVPTYVTIDTIAELDKYADKFGGKITGVDAGAGVMKQTEDMIIPAYGFKNISLMSSSGPAMTAALASAVKKEEWIVITAWKPHWMFGRWDLKFLKQDEDKMVWKSGDIHIVGQVDLETTKPELAQFLKNIYLTDAELSNLMVEVQNSKDDVAVVAQKWMHDHPEVVDAWIPQS